MLKGFFYDVDRYVQEESVILVSIIKWFFLSALVGAIVGLVGYFFLEALHSTTLFASGYSYFITLPLAFTLNMVIIRYIFPKSDAYTTNKVIMHVHGSKKIGFLSGVKAFIVPILSIASGGSVGKEAPLADVGATVGSMVASVFRLESGDWRKLSICGISAGFASVFGTPIAGALFGVELLFIGSMLYEMLLPCLVAGVTGFAVAKAMGATYLLHPVSIQLEFSMGLLFKILIAGALFGLCSMLVIEIIKFAREFTKLFKPYSWVKSIMGGLVLATMAYFLGTQYLGLGEKTIELALSNGAVAPYDFVVKILFTAVTLASGGIGGIITPVLFVGATAGNAVGNLLGLSPVVFAAIGTVAVLAGTTNTPIAASVLAIELFGPGIAPYAAVTCITSFVMTGYRSIYPGQILKMHKSTSIKTELGKSIDEVELEYRSDDQAVQIMGGIKTGVNKGFAFGVSTGVLARKIIPIRRKKRKGTTEVVADKLSDPEFVKPAEEVKTEEVSLKEAEVEEVVVKKAKPNEAKPEKEAKPDEDGAHDNA